MYSCEWIGHVTYFVNFFLKSYINVHKKYKFITGLSLSAYFNDFVYQLHILPLNFSLLLLI